MLTKLLSSEATLYLPVSLIAFHHVLNCTIAILFFYLSVDIPVLSYSSIGLPFSIYWHILFYCFLILILQNVNWAWEGVDGRRSFHRLPRNLPFPFFLVLDTNSTSDFGLVEERNSWKCTNENKLCQHLCPCSIVNFHI